MKLFFTHLQIYAILILFFCIKSTLFNLTHHYFSYYSRISFIVSVGLCILKMKQYFTIELICILSFKATIFNFKLIAFFVGSISIFSHLFMSSKPFLQSDSTELEELC